MHDPQRLFTGFALLVGSLLSGCELPDDSARTQELSLRSGSTTLTVTGNSNDGSVCFELGYQCERPEHVRFAIDAVDAWVYEGTSSFEHNGPPPLTCFDTSGMTTASHSFTLEEVCNSISTTANTTMVTSVAPIKPSSVVGNQSWYGAGDTIQVQVDAAQAGLVLSADLSALDSGYTTGDEIVTSTSGSYVLSYTLSSANTRASGDYEIELILENSTGAEVVVPTTLRYLPDGPMDVQVPSGSFHPSPPRSHGVDGSVTLTSVTLTTNTVTPTGFDDEHPDFSTHTTPPAYEGGTIAAVEFTSQGPDPLRHATLELWQPTRSGHLRVPLSLGSASCTATACTYLEEVVIARKSHDAGAALDLDAHLITATAASADVDTILPAETGPFEEYRIRGHVDFEHIMIFPDLDEPHDLAPQYAETRTVPGQQPARRFGIKVKDGCGIVTSGWTNEEGDFDIVFDSQCGEDPLELRISSLQAGVPWPISVFDRAPGQTNSFSNATALVNALSTDSDDYTIYTKMLIQAAAGITPEDVQAMPNFDVGDFTLDVSTGIAKAMYVATNIRRSLDYYSAWVDPIAMSQMNILLDQEEEVSPGTNRNLYAPTIHVGFIHITPDSTYSSFAHAHETGHYFHQIYLLGHDGVTYEGRFNEPMSHIHAGAIIRSSWAINELYGTAEDLDFNGAIDDGGVVRQADMTFYDSPASAAAAAGCNGGNPHPCCQQSDVGDCMLQHSSGWDWRIFWDLHDGADAEPVETVYPPSGPGVTVSDFDEVNGGGASLSPLNHDIMDVCVNYLGEDEYENPAYSDRGREKYDLVDVLDGMMCRGHMTQLAAEPLLHNIMSFGYDFAPNSLTCP